MRGWALGVLSYAFKVFARTLEVSELVNEIYIGMIILIFFYFVVILDVSEMCWRRSETVACYRPCAIKVMWSQSHALGKSGTEL